MIVKVEIEFEDLVKLIGERDDLKARIRQLEDKPLEFSRLSLARTVGREMTNLTPDQRNKMMELIEGPKL